MEKNASGENYIVSLSGGLDSGCLTQILLASGAKVYTIFLNRGQTNIEGEIGAVNSLDAHFSKKFPETYNSHPLDREELRAGRTFVSSAAIPSPEIKKLDRSIKQKLQNEAIFETFEDELLDATYAFRNPEMMLHAVRLGKQLKILYELEEEPTIALANVVSDSYGDSDPKVIRKFSEMVSIPVDAPFLERSWDKQDYIRHIMDECPDFVTTDKRTHKAPIHLTWSCYGYDGRLKQPGNEGKHCGSCKPCRRRKEAFNGAGLRDLTDYLS